MRKRLVSWYGSKAEMAEAIIDYLGPHRAYYEIFAGSMAVLLSKPAAPHEHVNDLHGDLINLARVVASDDAYALFERCTRTLACETLFREARQRVIEAADRSPLDRAYDFLLYSSIGTQGRNGTGNTAHGWEFQCPPVNTASTRWESVVKSIPAWYERLRHVTISSMDVFDLLTQIEDRPDVAIYADPPYVYGTVDRRYLHDFAPEDHERLAIGLGRFASAKVVVSYYDHPLVRDLYGDAARWQIIDASKRKSMSRTASTAEKRNVVSPEILILNRAASDDWARRRPTLF